MPALFGVIGFGGVLGPVLMLFGLARISALTGSFLLNLEAVFTIVLAVILFHEHLEVTSSVASAVIISGAALLSYQPGTVAGTSLGVLAIVAACLSWAIDNNLSQRLSVRDPVAIVQIKLAGAGLTSLVLARATGHAFPAPLFLFGALALGCLSYGASLICDHAGAAASRRGAGSCLVLNGALHWCCAVDSDFLCAADAAGTDRNDADGGWYFPAGPREAA